MKFRSKVINIVYRAEDVLSLSFLKPSEFKFYPGQFLFLTINKDGKELVKHFTISSSPTEDFLQITKKLTGHEYSNGLLGLEMGDEIGIDGPYGDFFYVGYPRKVLFITGGIGVTPIHSMIRYCVDTEVEVDAVLLYSCRFEENILFRDEFDEIKNSFTGFRIYYTLTRPDGDWSGLRGRIDSDMIRKFVPDFLLRTTYVSGPPGMVDGIVSILVKDLNVSKEKIKTENFLGL